MINEYLPPLIITLVGLLSLVSGARKPLQTIMLNLLILSVLIWHEKGPVEMLLFVCILLPVIFVAKKSLILTKKKDHSTIQEKILTYLAFLPSFGIYFLNREEIEGKLKTIVVTQQVMITFEIVLVIMTVLSIYAYLRGKSRL